MVIHTRSQILFYTFQYLRIRVDGSRTSVREKRESENENLLSISLL